MKREELIKRIQSWNLSHDDMAALAEVIPELRESKDERIRKAILGLTYLDGIEPILTKCSITAGDIRTYLEKQKEQEVDIDKLRRDLYQSGYNDGYRHGKEDVQKEQKPADLPAGFYFIDQDGNKYYSKEFRFNNGTFTTTMKVKEEQKPNFSEKDSTDFEIEVHEIIAQARNDSRLDDADVLKQFEEEAAFALMLKANKLIEQKPVERSEEDEENFKWFDKFFRAESVVAGGRDIPQDKYLWFKSLRPQPKEQDVEKYPEDKSFEDEWKDYYNNSLVSRLPMNKRGVAKHFYWFAKKNAWKPSEEQMDNLWAAIIPGYEFDCDILKELYDDLKKLM